MAEDKKVMIIKNSLERWIKQREKIEQAYKDEGCKDVDEQEDRLANSYKLYSHVFTLQMVKSVDEHAHQYVGVTNEDHRHFSGKGDDTDQVGRQNHNSIYRGSDQTLPRWGTGNRGCLIWVLIFLLALFIFG